MAGKTRPCEICNQPIDPERIEVVPETRLCSEHARMIGKFGGEFIVSTMQASLGKSGSLKKNYGDVSIEKRRNKLALEKLRADHEGRSEGNDG